MRFTIRFTRGSAPGKPAPDSVAAKGSDGSAASLENRRADPPPRLHNLSRADPIRMIAEQVMLGEPLAPGDLATVIEAVDVRKARWIRTMVGAWTLGRAPFEPEHRAEIVRVLAMALQRRGWSFNGCSAPLAVGCLGNLGAGAPALAYLLVCDARLNAVRTQAAVSLGLVGCVSAIGDLARATGDTNRPGCAALRQAARDALTALLPQLGPESYGTLPSGAEAAVAGLLNDLDPELQLAGLQGLRHIGGSASLKEVQRLVEESTPGPVRDLAAEVLPFVRRRAAQEQDAARLLRPAEAPEDPAQVLLRPADGPPHGPVDRLLRPAEEPRPAPAMTSEGAAESAGGEPHPEVEPESRPETNELRQR